MKIGSKLESLKMIRHQRRKKFEAFLLNISKETKRKFGIYNVFEVEKLILRITLIVDNDLILENIDR